MQIKIYGYHGTSRQNAANILQNGFEPSRNAYDWLGEGIYFWQDAPHRALAWAKSQHQQPAVLRAEISMDSDLALDLLDSDTDSWQVRELRSAYQVLQRFIDRQLPKQTAKYHGLDRLVIDFAIEQLQNRGKHIDLVRSIFIEGHPIYYELAHFYDRSHVQIAVRNHLIIQNIDII